jgi:hypothetical protein
MSSEIIVKQEDADYPLVVINVFCVLDNKFEYKNLSGIIERIKRFKCNPKKSALIIVKLSTKT